MEAEHQKNNSSGLCSARVVIECAFDRLKARFGCLRRDMDINIDNLPYVIHSCFVLHNFCEINREVINQSYVEAAKKFDLEFQPSTFKDTQLIGTNYMERK